MIFPPPSRLTIFASWSMFLLSPWNASISRDPEHLTQVIHLLDLLARLTNERRVLGVLTNERRVLPAGRADLTGRTSSSTHAVSDETCSAPWPPSSWQSSTGVLTNEKRVLVSITNERRVFRSSVLNNEMRVLGVFTNKRRELEILTNERQVLPAAPAPGLF